MSSLTTLRRSSPLISRFSSIQRLNNNTRSFFNQSEAQSSSTSSSSSSVVTSSVLATSKKFEKDSDFGLFYKSVSGIALATGLGFLFWSLPVHQSSISYADWQPNHNIPAIEDNVQQHSALRDVEHEKTPRKYLFGDAYRRRIFFNYEKRIRMRSPPEKVFEYFASHRNPEGEVFMTPADLMRAIVPVFPPSESNLVREGNLRGERNPGELRCTPSTFFMLFDTDGDGLISFSEVIDKEEFKKVMALMRAQNRQGAHHRDGRRTGFKVRHSVENGGLVEFFFGKDGKSCLQHASFDQFLKDLHEEILQLEFAHYDYKQRGTISAKDFALSMVASADMSHISKFLGRVDEMDSEPHLREVRITLEDFKAFAELRKKLQPLSLAIFSYGKVNGFLTKKDFQRAASNVCGVSLTNNVIDIIFHVFDVNRDGSLSAKEFVRVLHSREKPTTEGATDLILCWLNCAKDCSFKNAIF